MLDILFICKEEDLYLSINREIYIKPVIGEKVSFQGNLYIINDIVWKLELEDSSIESRMIVIIKRI